MLNEIIKGVSMKLNTTFGSRYKFYQNDVKQGFKPPCFFLAVLNPELTPLIGRRYINRNPLDIRYFPRDGADNGDMFIVALELMEALEFITLPNGDLVHGTGMNYEVVDGVLHFFVNYNLTLIKPTDNTPMETLAVDVGTTEG